MTRLTRWRSIVNTSAVATQPAASLRERFTLGEWMLLGVVALAFLHHLDHLLRADNSGWPFPPDLTPFTISLLVYPIFALDFVLLRDRPWVRVGLVAVLFVALQVTHAILEPPADQYGTWAKGTSAVPHALGQPTLAPHRLTDPGRPLGRRLQLAVAGRAGRAGPARPRSPRQPARARRKRAVMQPDNDREADPPHGSYAGIADALRAVDPCQCGERQTVRSRASPGPG